MNDQKSFPGLGILLAFAILLALWLQLTWPQLPIVLSTWVLILLLGLVLRARSRANNRPEKPDLAQPTASFRPTQPPVQAQSYQQGYTAQHSPDTILKEEETLDYESPVEQDYEQPAAHYPEQQAPL